MPYIHSCRRQLRMNVIGFLWNSTVLTCCTPLRISREIPPTSGRSGSFCLGKCTRSGKTGDGTWHPASLGRPSSDVLFFDSRPFSTIRTVVSLLNQLMSWKAGRRDDDDIIVTWIWTHEHTSTTPKMPTSLALSQLIPVVGRNVQPILANLYKV